MLNIRNSDLSDMLLYFNWANDPESRKNSFNSDQIPWDTHEQWCYFPGFTDRELRHKFNIKELKMSDTRRNYNSEFKQDAVNLSRELGKTACVESFFGRLKTRLTQHRAYESMEGLQRDIYWYIEIYYNRYCKHSSNNGMTPDQKELNFKLKQTKCA